jgi:uncharacterized membrane protein
VGVKFDMADQGIIMDNKKNQFKPFFALLGTFGGLFSFVKLILATMMIIYSYFYFYICCCFQKKEKKMNSELENRLIEREEELVEEDKIDEVIE